MAKVTTRKGKLYTRICIDGKWIWRALKATDKRAAQREADGVERFLLDPVNQAANETTLADAIDLFRASRIRKGVADGTMHMYGVKCAHLTRLIGERRPLSAITASVVDAFVDARLEEGAMRTTIGKELTALRGVLKIAKRAGKFPGDLKAIMPVDWSDDYTPRTRTLADLGHARQLLDYLATPRRDSGKQRNVLNQAAFAAFLLAAGCRLGEGQRARAGDIDLDKRQIFLRVTKTRKSGKGDRHVPITRLTLTLCEQIVAATQGRTALLFDPWTNIQGDLAKACEALKIGRISPNDLRRTHSTWLVDHGIPAQMVAEILGHMDTRLVERVYGRVTPAALQANVVRLLGSGEADPDGIEARHARACANMVRESAEVVRLFARVQKLEAENVKLRQRLILRGRR
jgi:integrase